MNIRGFEIDGRVSQLVIVLNCFPGVETFSSCEGHKNPKAGQAPHGTFYVDFFIEPTETGLLSLAWINKVVSSYFGKSASVKVGDVGGIEDEDEPCLCFEIRGRANPDELAFFLTEKGMNHMLKPDLSLALMA